MGLPGPKFPSRLGQATSLGGGIRGQEVVGVGALPNGNQEWGRGSLLTLEV